MTTHSLWSETSVQIQILLVGGPNRHVLIFHLTTTNPKVGLYNPSCGSFCDTRDRAFEYRGPVNFSYLWFLIPSFWRGMSREAWNILKSLGLLKESRLFRECL